MNTKTLKLSESEAFLKSISIRTIKDVRALDLDLLLVLNNGDRIIITGGAMHALNAPEMALQFADGQLPLARMFEQIERIDVSQEANLTVSSKEITRYNQNNARVRKSKTEDEDGDKPIVLDKGERNPAASSDSNGVGGNSEDFNFAPVRAADHQKQLADAEINSNKESDKNWGVQWPIAAGALALLAAAGGGGGGGGGGSNGGNGGHGGSANRSGGSGGAAGAAGSGSVEPPQATLSGAVALGPIRNANITAYDDRGNLLSATTEIVDGRYALTLNRPFYKGIMLLVVRDNTPGAADNYLDEASLRMGDGAGTALITQQTDLAGNISDDAVAPVERLALGTVAAGMVDLDRDRAGTQLRSTRAADTAQLIAGMRLVDDVAATSGAAAIRLMFAGSGFDENRDSIAGVVNPLSASWSLADQSIGGISGLSLRFNKTVAREDTFLEITRNAGAAFTAEQVKAVLEGLRLRNSIGSEGDREVSVMLLDSLGQPGNMSTSTTSVIANSLAIDLDPTTAGLQVSRTVLVGGGRLQEAIAVDDAISPPTAPNISKLSVTFSGAGLDNPATATIRIDAQPAPVLSAKLVDNKQTSFAQLLVPNDFGPNPNNLSTSEVATIPLPSGMTPAKMLSAIRGIYNHWGGVSITNHNNTTSSAFFSYSTFDTAPAFDTNFVMSHQSSTYVKGGFFQFNLLTGNGLGLKSVSQFFRDNTDVYNFTLPANTGSYDIGNIRLLYAVETNNANSTPSVAITYEKASVKAGDRLALYEGDRLLASKTLVAADVGGSGSATQTLTVAESLSAGDHQLVARFIGASGKTSQAAALNVSISDALKPELSNLKVASASAGATPVDLVQPGGRYASVSDFGAQGNGIYDKGLIFSGKVGTPGLATDDQKYLVTVSMGGKVLAFDIFNAGDFALTGVGGALAPGFYKDLSLTVTNVTTRPDNSPAANSGVTASVKDLSLGWYWAAQAMGDITGGHGNDGIILSPTAAGTRPAIQTGAGSDTLILGLFNKSQNYSASVTDFQLGVDKLAVFGRTLTAANFGDFARSVGHFSDGSGGTRLDIDLNGDTAGGVYSVYLQKLPYNPANLQTIFGI